MPRSPAHEWVLVSRFRGYAFGWRSPPTVHRGREATAEIQKVARKDPALAAAGAVLFLDANARRRARSAHATLMTTFPVARPASEYASASRTCSSGNTLSTSGLMTPLSTSRVISLSCSPSARMNRYS